jgi:hypothetical protein
MCSKNFTSNANTVLHDLKWWGCSFFSFENDFKR